MQLIGQLGGKKFLAAIGGVIAVILTSKFGLDPDTANHIITTILTVVLGFIGVQGATDIATGGATSSSTAPVDLTELKRVEQAIEAEKTKQAAHAATTAVANAEEAGHNATLAKHDLAAKAIDAGVTIPGVIERVISSISPKVEAVAPVDPIHDPIQAAIDAEAKPL